MSDTIPTPRTDAAAITAWVRRFDSNLPSDIVRAEKCAEIERELATRTAQRDALRKAGDKLASLLDAHIPAGLDNCQCEDCQALAAWSKLTK
jgi:hypothetical protein